LFYILLSFSKNAQSKQSPNLVTLASLPLTKKCIDVKKLPAMILALEVLINWLEAETGFFSANKKKRKEVTFLEKKSFVKFPRILKAKSFNLSVVDAMC
jgi:hypothetical protein